VPGTPVRRRRENTLCLGQVVTEYFAGVEMDHIGQITPLISWLQCSKLLYLLENQPKADT
jgi:hypothetical protein